MIKRLWNISTGRNLFCEEYRNSDLKHELFVLILQLKYGQEIERLEVKKGLRELLKIDDNTARKIVNTWKRAMKLGKFGKRLKIDN